MSAKTCCCCNHHTCDILLFQNTYYRLFPKAACALLYPYLLAEHFRDFFDQKLCNRQLFSETKTPRKVSLFKAGLRSHFSVQLNFISIANHAVCKTVLQRKNLGDVNAGIGMRSESLTFQPMANLLQGYRLAQWPFLVFRDQRECDS